jgi:hypothetical protein
LYYEVSFPADEWLVGFIGWDQESGSASVSDEDSRSDFSFSGGDRMNPRTLVNVVLLTLLTVAVSWAQPPQRNANPGVLPPHAEPFGLGYGEWGAMWWQWAEETDFLPVDDVTGEFCHLGQQGPVWFLAGTNLSFASEPIVRECTVPAGKGLFFPLMNIAVSTEGAGFEDLTEDQLRGIANWLVDQMAVSCTVNGKALKDLDKYVADSSLFTFFGHDAVSDGYWIMLTPLPVGEHTIAFSGVLVIPDDDPFELGFPPGLVLGLDVTYHLTVAPGNP